MNRHIIAITAGLFLMPSVAFTQNGYLGIGAGPANYSEASFDESDTGFTLYGGIRIHENFALELSYTDFGKQEGDYNSLNASVEVTGLGFSALGILPINDKFDIIGKIGFISWDADVTLDSLTSSDDGTDLLYGIGAQYNINEAFTIRGVWEFVDLDEGDLDMFSINAQFNF